MSLPSAGWLTSGNSGTNPAVNFIGTTDDKHLAFRVNNIPAGKIESSPGFNTSFGYNALNANTSGIQNTAVSANSLSSGNSSYNTAIGRNALLANTTGDWNTGVGLAALVANTTCMGTDATATGSDMVRIGNVYVTSIGGQVGWSTLSDGRFKEGVRENVPGLAFISQLRPVTYQLNRERVNEFIGVNERCKSSRRSSNSSKGSMSIFNARSGN